MNDEAESGSMEGRGAKWLAVSVVLLVLGAAATLVLLMKQAARPVQLEPAAGSDEAPVRPGQEAPQLPPPHRKLGEMPVVSEDRVVLNGLVPEAKACLDLDPGRVGASPGLGADAGYLGVLVEVAPSGRTARAVATSFAGARIPEPQATCIEAALLKLTFSRAASTRLLQRRFYLGGGAPPVEPLLPERVTDAAVAASLNALGEVGTRCPMLLDQQPASIAAWAAQVTFGPEGEPAWRASEPSVTPDAVACVNETLGNLRLPAAQRASKLSLRLACAGGRCRLSGAVEQTAEVVE